MKSELNGLQVALQELEVKEQKDKFDKGRLQGYVFCLMGNVNMEN